MAEQSQPERRSYNVFVDQHGREWGTPIDTKSGHSCGPWEPRFTAPWLPEFKYIKHVPKSFRNIYIDYAKNITDLKEAHDAFDELRLKTAMNQYGNAFTERLGQSHEEDPPELQKLTGKPPFPLAYPEAAKEGNKWVLGFSNVIPKWAYALLAVSQEPERKYLDADDEEVEKAVDLDEQFDPEATGGKREPVRKGVEAYEAFYKEQRALGKSHKEAQSLWRERKATTV